MTRPAIAGLVHCGRLRSFQPAWASSESRCCLGPVTYTGRSRP